MSGGALTHAEGSGVARTQSIVLIHKVERECGSMLAAVHMHKSLTACYDVDKVLTQLYNCCGFHVPNCRLQYGHPVRCQMRDAALGSETHRMPENYIICQKRFP